MIGRHIEGCVSDYGVSISALPSTITFASVRGSLGLPSAVAAFGRTLGRHRIIVVAALASATEGTKMVVSQHGGRGEGARVRGRRPPALSSHTSFLGGQDRRGHKGGSERPKGPASS